MNVNGFTVGWAATVTDVCEGQGMYLGGRRLPVMHSFLTLGSDIIFVSWQLLHGSNNN